MELTKQVPNLQLCKKLKELGWDKETLFVWSPIPKVVGKNGICETVGYDLAINGKQRTYGSKVCYPAPTVAELGEALPEWVVFKGFKYRFQIWRKCHDNNPNSLWGIRYNSSDYNYNPVEEKCPIISLEEQTIPIAKMGYGAEHDNFFATTEADARAKMWIYLKENKLL